MIDLGRALWIDVEASGLSPESYPIEVGWSDLDGNSDSILIKPLATWTDWDPSAVALHGISREQLAAEGAPVGEAAARIAAVTAGRVVLSDCTIWDMAWLSRLFVAAGRKHVPFRLEGALEAVRSIAAQRRIGAIGGIEAEFAAQQIAPITHRAADDARHWATLTRLVAQAGGK